MSNMDFSLIFKHMDVLLLGTKLTIMMTIGAITIGVILGTLLGLMRVSRSKLLRGVSAVYLQIFRGTPMLLQICFLYFAIPSLTSALGMSFSWKNPFLPDAALAGIIALGLNSGAYIAEIIRSGIQGVDIGQTEAGRSLGLSRTQTMWRIVIPQAVKTALPTYTSEFIALIKETSVLSFIAVMDLNKAGDMIRNATYNAWMPLLSIAAIYLLLTFGLTKLFSILERRLARSDRG